MQTASVDPDQTPSHDAASDLSLHCFIRHFVRILKVHTGYLSSYDKQQTEPA